MGQAERPIDMTKTDLGVTLKEYRKTQTIRAIQMGQPFSVVTKEGTMTGQNGDWLAIAHDDSPETPHRWPIAQDVFGRTYEEVQ